MGEHDASMVRDMVLQHQVKDLTRLRYSLAQHYAREMLRDFTDLYRAFHKTHGCNTTIDSTIDALGCLHHARICDGGLSSNSMASDISYIAKQILYPSQPTPLSTLHRLAHKLFHHLGNLPDLSNVHRHDDSSTIWLPIDVMRSEARLLSLMARSERQYLKFFNERGEEVSNEFILGEWAGLVSPKMGVKG
ncbi:hypothetical protein HDV00_010716 [Rhizophlyctis rosea]|nr:hypothetical protein HDV00_010716 [Rhizophlyctis rosea]